jgi:hypothetical protein
MLESSDQCHDGVGVASLEVVLMTALYAVEVVAVFVGLVGVEVGVLDVVLFASL